MHSVETERAAVITDQPGPPAMASFALHLRAEQPARFLQEPSRLVLAALYRALETVDARLARHVHEEQIKPFTLSPLYWAWPSRRPAYAVAPGEQVWLRITALERGILDALLAALSRHWRDETPLVLDWHVFKISAITPVAPCAFLGPSPLVTYTELLALTAPTDEVALRFTSPVVIRKGDDELPPSDQWRVFGGYLRRWNAYAEIPLTAVDEESVRRQIFLLEQPNLRRAVFRLGFEESSGYLGEVRFRVDGSITFRQQVAALATYASFCGTGARTALGMGQTERLS